MMPLALTYDHRLIRRRRRGPLLALGMPRPEEPFLLALEG